MKYTQITAFFLCALLLLTAVCGCRETEPTTPDNTDTTVTQTETEPVTEPEETEPPLVRDPVDPPIVAPYDVPTYQNVKSAFVYDSEKGLLFRQGDMKEPIYPASTTKLVTALVALEHCEPDEVFTAGDELYLVQVGASAAYIGVGCALSAEMLVEGMLLPSGCDASYVLAAGVGKKLNPEAANPAEAVAAFVDEMNAWCERNELTGSHFRNPDGFHADGHYSCMEDLLKIALLSMQNEIIAKYARMAGDAVTYASGHTNQWYNTNKILEPSSPYYKAECIGIKTGQTDFAGCCLLSCFCHEGRTVYIGTFGSETSDSRFAITTALAETYLPGVK